MMPRSRPLSPHFSSGPTKKFNGWTPAHLADAALGRSHRAKDPKAKIKFAIDRMSEMLGYLTIIALALCPHQIQVLLKWLCGLS